jgi:hypothetical protein
MMTIQGYLQAALKTIQEMQFNLSIQEATLTPEDYRWLLDYLTSGIEQANDFLTLALEQLKREP